MGNLSDLFDDYDDQQQTATLPPPAAGKPPGQLSELFDSFDTQTTEVFENRAKKPQDAPQATQDLTPPAPRKEAKPATATQQGILTPEIKPKQTPSAYQFFGGAFMPGETKGQLFDAEEFGALRQYAAERDYIPLDLEEFEALKTAWYAGDEKEAFKAIGKDTDRRAALYGKYFISLGGRVGLKKFLKKLNEDIAAEGEFTGLGLKTAGRLGSLALEMKLIYPLLFGAAETAGRLATKIKPVAKAVEKMKDITGLAKLAKTNPKTHRYLTQAMKAFGKGDVAGQTLAAVESVGKDKEFQDWIIDMNKRGLLIGSLATLFSLADTQTKFAAIKQLNIMRESAVSQQVRTDIANKTRIAERLDGYLEKAIYNIEQQMFGKQTFYKGKKVDAKKLFDSLIRHGITEQTIKMATKVPSRPKAERIELAKTTGYKTGYFAEKPEPFALTTGQTKVVGGKTLTEYKYTPTPKSVTVVKKPTQPIKQAQVTPKAPQAKFKVGDDIYYSHKGRIISGRIVDVKPQPATETMMADNLYVISPFESPKKTISAYESVSEIEPVTPKAEVKPRAVTGEGVISSTTTDLPFYDGILKKPDYHRTAKGLVAHIEQMTPDEYINRVAKMQGVTKEETLHHIDEESQKFLQEQIDKGEQLPMPVLDLAKNTQEGRNRAMLAKKLGQETIPVMVVEQAPTPTEGEKPKAKTPIELIREEESELAKKIDKAFKEDDLEQLKELRKETKFDQKIQLDHITIEVEKRKKPAERGREIFTSAPDDWIKEKTLVEWGSKKGIRTQGNRALSAGPGKKTRKTFIWTEDLTEIPVRLPKSTMDAFKARTDEIWKLQRRKADDVWLVPKRLADELREKLGSEAFEQRPKPERSPKQKINDLINSMKIQDLEEALIGENILEIAAGLGLTEDQLTDNMKNYIKEYRHEQESKAIPKDIQPGVGEKVLTEEELERIAIQEEKSAGEVGDFLEGIVEKEEEIIKIYVDKVPPTDVPTKVTLQNAVAKALNADAQKALDSKRKYKGLKNEKQLYDQQFADKPELFINPEDPLPEMRAAWTIATKGKGLFGGEFIEEPKGGATGGASVAAVSGEGGGYGTIAPSEQSTFAEKTQPHRVAQELPSKTTINVLDEILKIASPAHRGGARESARVLRKNLGELSHETVVAHEALKKIHHAFTFMERGDVYEFIDRLETGQKQTSPRLTQISQKFRKMLDDRRDAVQALGKGHLQNFYENYFPHIWKGPKVAEKAIMQIFGKRRLEGSKSFLKKRTIMTIKEGRDAGLELVSENPVDLILLKIFEMDRYLMAHHVIQDLKARGLVKFVYSRSMSPEGYAKIDDRAFTVYMPPEITKKEAYDSLLVDQLMDVARSLGIDTQRFVSLGKGKGKWWGYATWKTKTGEPVEKVRTRYAGPESVLAHEIGHILGYHYKLYEVLGRRREGQHKEITRGKKKGEKRFVPTESAKEHRKTIDKEWRALADARIKDIEKATESFKKYVRKAKEKEAVMLEALIHAPQEFKRVAPTLFKQFKAFLNNHSELRPLLDMKPSLVLGESDAKIKIPGFTVLGHYYAPEPVAKILNNYLSPGLRNNENVIIAGGYNMLRGAANIINQAQLALSGFHALNVTTDMMASTIGQGLRSISTKGQQLEGLTDILSFPISPVLRLWDGVRLRKAYKKQTDTIEDENLRNMVKAVVLAGGRDRMDPFYYNRQIKALKKTIGDVWKGSPGQAMKGIGKLPFNMFGATLELLAKPLMEWYVPTGKLGLYSLLAQREMKRAEAGQINAEQLHERLISSWDSVDNRMGQLVYDNLFWNKFLKDVAMLAVRSVGWNLGSWREYGGVPVDILGTKGRLERGDLLLSQKMAYTIGAIILYGLLGAMIMYLLTGEEPEEPKDYFFPKTGNKNPDGSDERLSLPTYAKDWFAYGTQPARTVTHKIHPLWGLLGDLATNEDYFSTEIRHPGDSITEQFLSVTEHIGKTFIPISMRNYQKMQRAAPEAKKKNLWVSITGIVSAPSYIVRSPAQKLMYRYIIENIPDKTKTRESQELYQYRKTLKNRLRKGDPIDREEAIKKLGKASFKRVVSDAKKEPLAESFSRLSLYQALNVYAIANKEEKSQTKVLLRGKFDRARKITPEMRQLYKELMKNDN